MVTFGVNWVAVAVAATMNMIIGTLWYSKLMFAEPWMKQVGKKLDDMKRPGPAYAATMIGAVVQAFVLANIVAGAMAYTWLAGAGIGFFVWLGIVATVMGTNYIFGGRSFKLYLIDASYFLVVLVVNGALLAVWR